MSTTQARRERKVVTVLFADLVGFTARSEELDPEDVEAILGPYHERLRFELERFGGTVEKFIGDAVMALFGAPVAHEDDPERAVRAALAIRDWARDEPSVQVRIAVNTGEALINLDARPESGQGMAAGDVVNTTARLQSAAPVNGVLVGAATYRATKERIDYREAEPVEAKGKADPVPVWEAVDARSRVEVERPAAAPLVGRERELDTLRDVLARAKERRQPQLLTLVGVPGIGKSRLVYELYRSIEQGGELIYWRRGRSLPYGEGVSLWALGEIVKAQAGILESDAAGVAEEKLRTAVEALIDESDAAWVTRHLIAVVGAGSGVELSGDRREEAFSAWRRFLEALAEDRPLVLVFEDLHWADDGVLDFVDHLVDWAERVPMLVLCTARPELLERRPAWGGGKVNAATVLLEPLSDDETALLVHALLGRSVLAAELQATVLERAGGNPLYAEEFVRLLEEDRGDIELPESVQGIIAARLDVLAPEEKRLLQDAAVAGRTFWLSALVAVGDRDERAVERALHGLARREFVQRERRSSVEGETQYLFRHALVREVVYNQIPRAERAEKHRRAAEWIESLGRQEDHAEMLAHHYLSALEYARAANTDVTPLVEPARRSLRAAGERALALGAFVSAIRFFEAALGLLAEDDAEYASLLFGFATALQRSGDQRADAQLDRAAELLTERGERERAAVARTLLAESAWHVLDRPRCRIELEKARELVVGVPPSPSVARVRSELSRYHALGGEYEEAIELGREALAAAEELGLPELQAHALGNIGIARVSGGDPRGVDDLERAIEVAEAANSPEAARAYNNLGAFAEDSDRRYELLSAALRVAERFGLTPMARFMRGQLITRDCGRGRWDEFVAAVDEYLAESARVGGSYQDIYLHQFRAGIRVARADDEGARADADRALTLARVAGDPQVLVPGLAQAAFVAAELGDASAAEKLAHEAVQSAAGTQYITWLGMLPYVADRVGVADELLEALVRAPRRREVEILELVARGRFADAADRMTDPQEVVEVAYARLRAGEQLAAAGRQAEADAQLRESLAFWRSVGATRYIRRAEALSAKSA
ncbi:MAG TPA: AAA family ATPase [Gaiellaceae bacterium]